MRAKIVGLALGAVLSTTTAWASDGTDPTHCTGLDWSDKQALVVSKIASSRVNFIKSSYDDNFKAVTCPAATDACRKKSYLVEGDLVLTGKTRGEFTCVSYQSPTAKQRGWSRGWMPTTSLAPVAPMAAPNEADWIGTWSHPGGDIEIKRGADGKLNVSGEMSNPGGLNPQTADIDADVVPTRDSIAFVDDGSKPFEKAEGECRVRVQRIADWLLVQDNVGCGSVGVTFTGLYHRKK